MKSIRDEIMAWPVETARLDRERILGQKEPGGVTVDREHWYEEDRSPWHSYETVRPVGGRTRKGLVFEIHGGAWIYGNKELNEHHTMYMASKGYDSVSVTYGLVRDHTLMESVRDIISCMAEIEERNDEFGFDLSKVLVTGDSAGAHLSALTYAVLSSERMQELYGIKRKPGFRISALGLSHPVMCLEPLGSMGDTPEKDGLISEEILRMMTGEHEYRKSPVYGHMSFEDFAGTTQWPPLFIITSRADVWRPNTERALRCLDELKVPYDLLDFEEREDLGHVFHIGWWDKKESIRANDAMLDWFDTI